MKITEVLPFVGALWAIYITFISINFKKPFIIYGNLLASCTGSKHKLENIEIDGMSYSRFSIQDYKDVPRAFSLIRLQYRTFKIVIIFATVLFFIFIGLGIFTAITVWDVIGSTDLIISSDRAQILICGHIIIFFITIGIFPFFRYFENLYLNSIYIIDDQGNRTKKNIDSENE